MDRKGRHAPHLPMLAVLAGIAAFSTMDVAMKSAAIAAGVFSTLLLRNLFAAALILPFWLRAGVRLPDRPATKVHVQRAVVVSGMASLFFYGLVRIPMAEALALSFIAPLIALFFASAMLGEAIRPGAIAASLLGVAGVAVIAAARISGDWASPGMAGGMDFETVAGVAAILASAVLYAVNLVLQRRQALIASPVDIACYQNVLVALILLPAAPWLFALPQPAVLAHIGVAAVLIVVALLLLSWGYARAETQHLLPLEYTAFLWAALFGWLVFGERLGWTTVAGAVLIVGSCLLAARRVRDGSARPLDANPSQ